MLILLVGNFWIIWVMKIAHVLVGEDSRLWILGENFFSAQSPRWVLALLLSPYAGEWMFSSFLFLEGIPFGGPGTMWYSYFLHHSSYRPSVFHLFSVCEWKPISRLLELVQDAQHLLMLVPFWFNSAFNPQGFSLLYCELNCTLKNSFEICALVF